MNKTAQKYIFAIFIVWAIVACSITGTSPVPTNTPANTPEPENPETPGPQPTITSSPEPTPSDTSNIGKIGETLRFEGIVFRVNGIRRVDPEDISSLYSLPEGHIYLVLDVYLENVGLPEGLSIDPLDGFHLTDNNGVDFGSDINPMTAAGVAGSPHIRDAKSWHGRPAKLELGESAQGAIVFDITVSSSEFVLTYNSLIFLNNSLAKGPVFQINLE